MAPKRDKLIAMLIGGSACLSGCGRDLELEPRRTMSADDLAQHLEVTIFATAEGAKSYAASLTFRAGTNDDAPSVAVADDDTVTLNGTAMSLAADGSGAYAATGSGNPGTFQFVWAHEDDTYENTLTAVVYAPTETPTTVSKSGDESVVVAGVPAGVTVSATLNAGTTIAAPFYGVLVEVSGGGVAADDAADLSELEAGPGVLTVLEVGDYALQDPTAADGSGTVTVQFAYNVTITE